MAKQAPPPVLDSARVMSYALVDDIVYRQSGALIVDVLGCVIGDDVDSLKERAEKNYPGVRSRWVDVNTSIADALRYLDVQT